MSKHRKITTILDISSDDESEIDINKTKKLKINNKKKSKRKKEKDEIKDEGYEIYIKKKKIGKDSKSEIVYIKILSELLINKLLEIFDDMEEFYDDIPTIKIDIFFNKIPILKKKLETIKEDGIKKKVNNDMDDVLTFLGISKKTNLNSSDDIELLEYQLESLIKYLDDYFMDKMNKIDNLLEQGVIDFDNLNYYFQKNDDVFMYDNNDNIWAGKITNTNLHKTLFGSFFSVSFNSIIYQSKYFRKIEKNISIPMFNGVKKINELAIKKLDIDTKKELNLRGGLYMEYCKKPTYLEYTGNRYAKSWWGIESILSTGRIMIDVLGAEINWSSADKGTRRKKIGEELDSSLFYSLSPYLYGYSLNHNKGWGEFVVSHLRPINFKKDAFDTLVLPSKNLDKNFTSNFDRKTLIMSLIKDKIGDNNSQFKDVISGKGGGLIFLLHGPPGVGKTLTAEATAEITNRPLYSISVGELGNTPEDLETSLRKILEIATSWNAVILFDEADVYLEKRNSDDIVRNALVGVFLRLLEYHDGIIFLTTNRVKHFDEAIFSRISLAFFYNDLDVHTRINIWKNLLKSANIQLSCNNLDDLYNTLAQYNINGRQIKNAIRLAQSLANELTTDNLVTLEHLIFVINQITNKDGFDKTL